MAKLTLLELVQKVLNSTNGDEVASINETVESLMVANIIEDVYFNLITNGTIPEHNDILKVDALADADYPNYLKLPTAVRRISSFKYDRTTDSSTETLYTEAKYVSPEEFIQRTVNRNQADANVVVVTDFSGVKLLIVNDKFPDFWTSFDDEYMVFDSWNNDEDSTLQSSKTMAIGTEIPTFTLEDDHIPDIDDNLFPLLLNEAKSWAHFELKQQVHTKAEQQSRKQRVSYQDDKERFKQKGNYADYGRK